MRNRILYSSLFFLLLSLLSLQLSAQDRYLRRLLNLSPKAEVALLTCSPGNQLYETFGHSAIRVYDPARGVDLVFNYGTFNFNTPHFYTKFASGRLLYELSVEPRRQFIHKYQREDLKVVEQTLNLRAEEKQLFVKRLVQVYYSDERYYQYDFLLDNCATRIIDLFEEVFADSLVYQPQVQLEEKSFRDMLYEYLAPSRWSKFGVSLLLGTITDRVATEREQTFLPDYLMNYCKGLSLHGEPFVQEQKLMHQGHSKVPTTPFLLRPEFWLLLAFVIFLFFQIKYRNKNWLLADKTIYFVFGVLGVLVFLESFFAEHLAVQRNFNLLWVHPLYLVLAFALNARKSRFKLVLAATILTGNIFALLGWFFIPQVYYWLFLPFILVVVIRLSFYIRTYQQKAS